jgi:phage terminase large subunit-like protein
MSMARGRPARPAAADRIAAVVDPSGAGRRRPPAGRRVTARQRDGSRMTLADRPPKKVAKASPASSIP